jgi:hypothetical protein
MASVQDRIRAKLTIKLFNKIGKSVTLINKSAPLYNSRGELESYTPVNSTITVVPYNITTKSLEYNTFGDLQTGDMFVAVPYNISVAIGSQFIIDTIRWEIKEIQENLLPGNVVTIVRIARVAA